MAGKKLPKIELKKADDLFTSSESTAEEKVIKIPVNEIHDFPDHPFKVRKDDEMLKMATSIAEYGVLNPVLVRPREKGGYELVSGHRRKFGAVLNKLTEIDAIVRNLTYDEAVIVMVDSNLQREKILPSEKAKAFKMKMKALKRQGKRNDLTSAPVEQKSDKSTCRPVVDKLKVADEIGAEVGESGRQIQRYIRLNELEPEILDMVDEGKIAFRPAVELSYLPKEEQMSLVETMNYEEATPSLAQAVKMKKFSSEGKLNDDVILSIMCEEKPNQREQIKIPREKLKKYFSATTPVKEVEETIIKALDMYMKKERSKAR